MAMLTHPSFGPKAALTYVTIGALLDVWTGVWYFAFRPDGQLSSTATFWVWGLFLTGLTLMFIGLALGPLGRSARQAELPPAEATGAEARIQQTAAATPRPVVQGAPAAPQANYAGQAPGTGNAALIVGPGDVPGQSPMARASI